MDSCWVIALQAEAQPLIEYLRLDSLSTAPFAVYGKDMPSLVVSGPGKAASAAATAYLQAIRASAVPCVWLNVGIAGHADKALGEVVLAHHIRDFSARRNWYPPQLFTPPCATAAVLTVDRPQYHYRGAWLYDMEAAGFFATASRFRSSEWVQCLKVISDNQDHPATSLDRGKVRALIQQALPQCEALLHCLATLAGQMPPAVANEEGVLQAFFDHWHFSVTQQHALRALLRRWQALSPEKDCKPANWVHLQRSSLVLTAIRHYLDDLPMRFPVSKKP